MRIKRVRFENQNHTQVVYVTEEGGMIKREYGVSPSNTLFDGQWVYRDKNGDILQWSAYRNDIFDKYQLVQEDGE